MDTNASDSSIQLTFLRAVKTGNVKQIKKFLASGKFNPTILVPGKDDCDENDQPYGTMKTNMVSSVDPSVQ